MTKRTWGAFHGTTLDEQLRARGVTQVVVTGVSTSAGVESTARSAHEHGYHVVLATDAMTDTSGDAHANSVERIFPRLGETGTTDEILEVLDEIDAKVDQRKMEDKLMEEGTAKFADPQHALLKLIAEKRAALTAAK